MNLWALKIASQDLSLLAAESYKFFPRNKNSNIFLTKQEFCYELQKFNSIASNYQPYGNQS